MLISDRAYWAKAYLDHCRSFLAALLAHGSMCLRCCSCQALIEGHWQRIQVSNLEKQLPYKGHLIPIAPYLFMYCNIYKNWNSKSEGQKTHTYILYFLFTFDMCSGISSCPATHYSAKWECDSGVFRGHSREWLLVHCWCGGCQQPSNNFDHGASAGAWDGTM